MEGQNRVTRNRRSEDSEERTWDQMKNDVLVMIFATFHVMDLVMSFSKVCRSWHAACSDQSIWKAQILDLSVLGRYLSIPETPEAWKDQRSSQTYTRILKHAFDISGENITKLIFNFHVHIHDEHLDLVAARCTGLKHLALPRWHGLSLNALQRCLGIWGSTLESLMVPDICSPSELLIQMIGENCPNLKDLKFMTNLDKRLATLIVKFLPGLKALSIRGTIIEMNALELLRSKLLNLDVLNITHTHISILEHHPGSPMLRLCSLSYVNSPLAQSATRPTHLLSCDRSNCSCRNQCSVWRKAYTEDELRWRSGEDFWRADEISSLSY